jgi:hypothetical protein
LVEGEVTGNGIVEEGHMACVGGDWGCGRSKDPNRKQKKLLKLKGKERRKPKGMEKVYKGGGGVEALLHGWEREDFCRAVLFFLQRAEKE